MLYSEELPEVNEKIKEIKPILDKYKFDDLIKAIYCINICCNNRSVLTSQLTLNLGLALHEERGNETICTYEEFKRFFSRIENILGPDLYDDYIIEDFGDVKYRYKNKYYSIILGTGHNQVYGATYFLEGIANSLNKEDELEKIFQYNSSIIDYFVKSNKTNGNIGKRLVLPSKELFETTRNFFEQKIKQLNIEEIYIILDEQEKPIEKRHFIKRDNIIYPLYNNSILIDILDKWHKQINDKERIKIADQVILKALSKLTVLDDNKQPNAVFPATFYDFENLKQKYMYTFIIKCSNSAIIAINENQFESVPELKKEIEKIRKAHYENKLNLIELRRRNDEERNVGLTITQSCNLYFIIYNSYMNISETYFSFCEKEEKCYRCTALDLLYMLLFMDSQEELAKYISEEDADKGYDRLFGFGGDSSRFLIWKQFNHMLVQGAIRYGIIDIGYNSENDYVWDYFRSELKNYPFILSNEFLFSTPFLWRIDPGEEGYDQYVYKIGKNFGGIIKRFDNGAVMFFTHNIDLFKGISNFQGYFEVIKLIDELNIRKIKNCEEIVKKSSNLSNKLIQILFMPLEYGMKIGLKMDANREYVYSECRNVENTIIIRYTVDYNKLKVDIMNAKNRNVENLYFKELLKPIETYYKEEYDDICELLDKYEEEKKEVSVFAANIDYVYNMSLKSYNVENVDYLMAKKEIAKICLESGIKEGEYFGKEANKVVRTMQKKLIEFFENEIVKYNKRHLHIELVELLASTVNSINIHKKRYESFENIDQKVLDEIQITTINERERDKHNYRTILYLIETNLWLDREGGETINAEALQYLLAFANWLVVLSDSADICYFTDREAHIEVNYDYVVDALLEENDDAIDNEFNKRIYSSNGHAIKSDKEDEVFLEKALQSFKNDTNVDMICVFFVCCYLQGHIIETGRCKQLLENVYSIHADELIEGICNYIKENSNECFQKDEINRAIQFLSINAKKLKTINNIEDYYLPIGEREKRDNRFDIRPLFEIDDEIIFSPVLLSYVHTQWRNGIIDNYLPYEIGLEKTVQILMEWKKKYEKEMVDDIAVLFQKNNINFTRTNVSLHKIDKAGKHPLNLGDYDVLAIDDCKCKIWIIESKVLKKVGNFFEMFNQQRRFFLEHKEDEKFQRRIDYMNNNYKKILSAFGFDTTNEYEVIPYMVINKVMKSRYKEIQFPIISIEELADELKE